MNYKPLLIKALAHAKSRGLSRFKVAAKAGVTEGAIQHWLSGRNAPNIMTLGYVINACGYQFKITMHKADSDE